jgi:hypothetical protein
MRTSMTTRSVLLLIVLLGGTACGKKIEQTASASATVTTREKCPFPKRCDQVCKDAFSNVPEACAKDIDALKKVLGPQARELAGCNSRCVTHKDDGCAGPLVESECKCFDDCRSKLPPEAKAGYDAYHQCVASAVKSCE